jgi:DNA-binding transcriptional LysR family regulator
MELRHLRYFVAVAEEENVTRAAQRLHVSQPPLSRQIRDLEEELSVQLFERGAKSVRLTDAGRVFLNEARAVLDRAEEATRAVKAISSGASGELHVGYAPSLAVDILPRALRQFQVEMPGVRVQLHDLSTDEMLTGLRDNKIAVALMVQQPAQNLRGLHSVQLQCYRISIAVSPIHPLARLKQVGFDQIVSERILGYSQKDYPEFLHWFVRLPWPNNKAPRLAEEHDSVTSLIAAVEVGRGIAVAPDSLACLAGPRLKLVPLVPQPEPFAVIGAWRSSDAKIKRFIENAKDASNMIVGVRTRHPLRPKRNQRQ